MDTRCSRPSVWWVRIGSFGGSGWCVCDEHKDRVISDHAGLLAYRATKLAGDSAVLLTAAGVAENRSRCQWDNVVHARMTVFPEPITVGDGVVSSYADMIDGIRRRTNESVRSDENEQRMRDRICELEEKVKNSVDWGRWWERSDVLLWLVQQKMWLAFYGIEAGKHVTRRD